MLLDVVDADPVLGDKPFDKDNKALRRIVRTGLKEFPIIHDAFVEKIVDHALKSEPDEELADYDQEAVQSYKLNLAREWTNYVKKHPNLVGNHEEASYVLVEVAMSARLTVEIARKTSKGQQVNFLNKLLTNMDQAEGEDSN
jgi:hypothetical protein